MRSWILGFLAVVWVVRLAAAAPEAIVIVAGDQHSAYERTAQFVGVVDRLRAENPGVPLAVLIDGDSLEYGNVVARRTSGAIDFAMFAALARRVPTVVNLGNHEPEFFDVADTVRRLEATGARVISGNLRDPATKQSYAPASTRLKLGPHELAIVGVGTDRLSTYRVAVRPQLDLADPVVWAKENFSRVWEQAPGARPVVLSHAGLKADRAILPLVPEGTLFAGAHDHLRFVHCEGRTVYFHSGSWMEVVSVARLQRGPQGLDWRVESHPIESDAPADPELARLVRETLTAQLTPAETASVGRTPRALAPAAAARFAVEAARRAAGADAALVGATTFGAGLPAGEVSRHAFDACVRFDGPLFAAEVDGAWLAALLARANQEPETPFAARGGENLIVSTKDVPRVGTTYRFVTTDWVAKNARAYLGENPPALKEVSGMTLKSAVLEALKP